jgi:DNA-binding transcriptional MerR regulator
MDGYSISEAASTTGFTPSALRFYEKAGLVAPSRTGSGYRCYDDDHIDTLRFVARAKGFGLTLDEITGLVPLVTAAEECAAGEAEATGIRGHQDR